MTDVLYARVSTDRQEREETIQSQLAELRARATADGRVDWVEACDEGYSRDDLVRPGLDHLRDLSDQREIERVYIQSPDRLASGPRLILLVEELEQHGVQTVFLRGAVDDTPEGKLLLGMQGLIADYERTKIAERTRRGKLYWARQGAHVGGHAPYGYHFVRRSDEARAHLVVDEEKAPVVRRMYRMLVDEQLSMRAIAMRLTADEVLTAHGARQWQPTAVDRMLRNPVYRGVHYYQRTQAVAPSRRRTTDPYKQHRKTGHKPRPQEDWIPIPVPPIVTEALWEAAQAQLVQNSLHSPRNNKRRQYLLRGLIRCPRCGGAYIGYGRKDYRGYRCIGAIPESSSTGHRCPPGGIPAEPVEEAVWAAVTEAFQHPDLLLTEYTRRLAESSSAGALDAEQAQIAVALKRVAAQEDRVTQAYVNEAMDIARYKAEMEKLKQRRHELDHAAKDIERRARQELDARDALAHLQRFCDQVCQGLEAMAFDERQQFLRLVVERITVEDRTVRVDTIIPLDGPADRDVGRLRTRRAEALEVRTNGSRHRRWATGAQL